ncbi:MAG: hypothetical protein JWP52_1480 [Rhizobacter sp.]|jgi:hypothetical protein|nr:hypothetical protein [Rhizobacter sp.]
MSRESPEQRRIQATVAWRAGHRTEPADIADAVVATWQDITVALTPIIGSGGIAALYQRSLYLTSPAHPWLADQHKGVAAVMNLAALKTAIAAQGRESAGAAGVALLQTFHELLTTLVGPSLTERLLRSVWENPSSGAPAQDTSA